GDKTTFRREYPTVPIHAFAATSKNCFDLESLDQMRAHVEREGIQPVRFRYKQDLENGNPDEKFTRDPYGPLVVYCPPQRNAQYVIAADPSMGIQNSGDPSALIVLDCGDLKEVASYNAVVRPDIFAEVCHWLGLLYNHALLGVENN